MTGRPVDFNQEIDKGLLDGLFRTHMEIRCPARLSFKPEFELRQKKRPLEPHLGVGLLRGQFNGNLIQRRIAQGKNLDIRIQ